MEILNKSLSNKKRPTGRFFNFYCKAMVDGLLVKCIRKSKFNTGQAVLKTSNLYDLRYILDVFNQDHIYVG